MGFSGFLFPDALGQVNASHGLANRLQSAFVFNSAGLPVDLINPKRVVAAFNYAFDGPGANGPSLKASVNTGYVRLTPSVPVVNSAWTVSARCRFPIDSNAFAIFACSRTANAFHVLRNNATDALCCFNGSATNFSPTIAPLTLSGWKRLTVVGNAAGARAYLDGSFVGSHATPINVPVEDLLGDHSGNNTTRAWGAVSDYFVWDRSLSSGEVMEHALDPYAMFRNDDDWLVTLLTAGGNVPTNITLGQASWVWTGRAPSVNAKTMITLAAASVVATGLAAAIDAKTMITLAQGTWQWIGRPLAGTAAAIIQSLLTFLGVG